MRHTLGYAQLTVTDFLTRSAEQIANSAERFMRSTDQIDIEGVSQMASDRFAIVGREVGTLATRVNQQLNSLIGSMRDLNRSSTGLGSHHSANTEYDESVDPTFLILPDDLKMVILQDQLKASISDGVAFGSINKEMRRLYNSVGAKDIKLADSIVKGCQLADHYIDHPNPVVRSHANQFIRAYEQFCHDRPSSLIGSVNMASDPDHASHLYAQRLLYDILSNSDALDKRIPIVRAISAFGESAVIFYHPLHHIIADANEALDLRLEAIPQFETFLTTHVQAQTLLLRLLEEDSSDLIRTAVVEALIPLRHASNSVIDKLMSAVEHDASGSVRSYALYALEGLEQKPPFLQNFMAHIAIVSPSKPLRIQAIQAMSRFVNQNSVMQESLFFILSHESNYSVRIAALNAVASIEAKSEPMIKLVLSLAALDEESPLVKAALTVVATMSDREECMRLLVTLLKPNRSAVQSKLLAAQMLIKCAQTRPEAQNVLQALVVGHEHKNVRIAAMETLGQHAYQDLNVLNLFVDRLYDEPNMAIKLEAARQLGVVTNRLQSDYNSLNHLQFPVGVNDVNDVHGVGQQSNLLQRLRALVVRACTNATHHSDVNVRLAALIGLAQIEEKDQSLLDRIGMMSNSDRDQRVKAQADTILYQERHGFREEVSSDFTYERYAI